MGMSLQLFKGAESVAEFDFLLSDMRDTYAEIARAQDEVGGGMVLYRVKVATGGGKSFDVVTGDEDMDTSVQKFAGVILYSHSCNARFDEDAVGNTPPVCSSIDGKVGMIAGTGVCSRCSGCPYNEFGTDRNGRGKACKNMVRLYVMTEGMPIPLLLTLPPTSIKAYKTYRTTSLASRRLTPEHVVTEFSLEQQTSAAGQKYSTVKFRLAGKLPPEQCEVADYFAASIKEAQRAAAVTGEDYNREERTEVQDAEAQ